ncbi:MAG TPA: YjgP/YjgQ family permease [bacterium]|nr:YjgP/YjgQ family permease [bacterium]
MKILHRYIISEIIKYFLIILSGIIVLILVSTMIDEIGLLLRHKPGAFLIFTYYFFRIPFFVAYGVPFAMLFSILFVFSQFSKYNELTAMKSTGINFTRIASPVLILALIISVLNFALNETFVSSSFERSKYIKDVLIEKKPKTSISISHDLAKLGKGGKIFYIKFFDELLGRMKGVCILQLDADFNITERLDAREGIWENENWTLKDGVHRTFDKEGSETGINIFDSYDLEISDTPSDFIVRKQSADDTLTVNIMRLSRLIRILKDSGFNYREEAVNLHLKIAFPFAAFILALLGVSIPFMFTSQRSLINAALGFLFTVLTAFFYLGFVTIGISLGKAAYLTPFVSAWIANFVFTALGFFFLSKVKK